MAKRRKRKVGLQKKVSSVFEGVSTPQREEEPHNPQTSTPDNACSATKPMSADSLISKSSLMKKVRRPKGSSDKASTNPINTVLSKKRTSGHPAPKESLTQKRHQADDMQDKVPPDRTIGIPPKLTALDHLIPHLSSAKKPPKAEESSDKAESDRTIDIPSWMMSPDYPDLQSPSTDEPTHSIDSSSKAESDRAGGISRMSQNRSTPRSPSAAESQQGDHLPDKVAPSRKSWVPPKLITPDRSISEVSATKKSKQARIARDKVKPSRTDVGDPKKQSAIEHPAAQSPPAKKLHQAESIPDSSTPDRMTKVPPIPKVTEPPKPQISTPEKRYGPEAPPKETVPSGQDEKTVLTEASGPSLWQQINNRLFAPKPGVSPTRQKVMVITIPILAIILIFIFRQVLSKSPRKTKGDPAGDVALTVADDPGHEIDWQIPEPLPEIMRDPIQFPAQNNTQEEDPPTVDTKKSELLNLGTIVYSHDKPSAVVNGRIVHIGDEVNGVTILKINRDSVEFEKDGEKWIQKVHD